MTIGKQIGGVEETVDLVAVLAILGVVIYIVYKFPDWWDQILTEIGKDIHAPIQAIKDVFNPADIGGYDTPSDTAAGKPAISTSGSGETTPLQHCFTCEAGLVLAGTCNQSQIGQQICVDIVS